jgi:hypothetical protein
MTRRIYFLSPGVDSTHKIVDELRAKGVEERHIHVIAKESSPLWSRDQPFATKPGEGVDLGDLPRANLLQKSDFIPAMERAVAIGGATGMIAGLVAIVLPTGLVLGGGAVLASTLAGAGIGAWLSGMVAMDLPNSRLKKYEDAIEKGELLVLIDIPKDRIDELSAVIRKHHPEAEFEGIEPIIPPPPPID